MAGLMIESPHVKPIHGGMKIDVFANEFSKNYHRTFDKMCEDILIGK